MGAFSPCRGGAPGFVPGEAVLTGLLVAIFVAFRPQRLATCADRLCLPKD
ncbi:MAG: hypothetical protein QE285_18500 [Aquabacterium sp.]|nr:hypothetical protein [Aquabacterium sp.]